MSVAFELILRIILLLLALNWAAAVAHWVSCRVAGVPVDSLELFFGPKVLQFQLQGVAVSIGCIPTGTALKYSVPAYRAKSLAVRLFVPLSGMLPFLLTAVLCLGFAPTFHHLRSGFWEVVNGALHPQTVAIELIDRLRAVDVRCVSCSIAIAATKVVALSFFPIGGTVTVQCLQQMLDPDMNRRWMTWWYTLNVLLAIAIHISWLVALLMYAFGAGSSLR